MHGDLSSKYHIVKSLKAKDFAHFNIEFFSVTQCARQGFALGLSVVVAKIPTIKVESLMKLIVNLLEVSASMKGQVSLKTYLCNSVKQILYSILCCNLISSITL